MQSPIKWFMDKFNPETNMLRNPPMLKKTMSDNPINPISKSSSRSPRKISNEKLKKKKIVSIHARPPYF